MNLFTYLFTFFRLYLVFLMLFKNYKLFNIIIQLNHYSSICVKIFFFIYQGMEHTASVCIYMSIYPST